MKTQITLLLMSSFLLTGIWFPGNGQTGESAAVAEARAEVEKCREELNDHDLRVNNLGVLLWAYTRFYGEGDAELTKEEREQYDRWQEERWKLTLEDKWGNSERKWLCMELARFEGHLQTEIEKSKQTPTPTPTPSPSPANNSTESAPKQSPTPMALPTRPTPALIVAPSPTPTPTPAATPAPKPSPKKKLTKEEEEELKRLKGILDRLGPLTAEVNDWVKKRKAKLPPVKAPDGLETDKRWRPGIQSVSFDLPQGSIVVNLPDAVQAGDTISGTVMVESKGPTETERNQNSTALQRFAIELNMPDTTIVRVPLSTVRNNFAFVMGSDPGTGTVGCTLVTRNGADIAKLEVPISQAPPVTPNAKTPRPAEFQFPTLVQQGGPLKIIGPFDGNFKTTAVELGGQPARVLAESRNSCIVQAPDQILGLTEITVKEGDVEAKGSCRNLGVRLAAPKTSLLKGETTVLTITVEGLKGIQQSVPLLLQKQGVVSMEGGDTQTVQIRPGDVRPDGTFQTQRTLTGVQAGNFGVTATVIDPARRPIIIPLTENAKVNGFRVKKEGDKFVVYVENVQSPITGDPVDGEHKLEHQCPGLTRVPYINRLFLNKGIGKTKSECLTLITPRIIIQEESQ